MTSTVTSPERSPCLACSAPPKDAKRWTTRSLTKAAHLRPTLRKISRESVRRLLRKTAAHEYRQRMYLLLELYARPYDEKDPVICIDEKSKQLIQQTLTPIAARAGMPIKEDYEYKRAGTRNIFLAVEPKGGRCQAEVTARRTNTDFVRFIGQLVGKVYVPLNANQT